MLVVYEQNYYGNQLRERKKNVFGKQIIYSGKQVVCWFENKTKKLQNGGCFSLVKTIYKHRKKTILGLKTH